VNVTWDDAVSYCSWLSQTTGQSYRLPYEAEWEYAARGGGNRLRYPTGAILSRTRENVEGYDLWASNEKLPGTTPVGAHPPNRLGLYDLAGNVHEWVLDWYASDYYSSSPSDNPTGPVEGITRVERGGSWRSPVGISRTANRNHAKPDLRVSNLGFRVCLPAE